MSEAGRIGVWIVGARGSVALCTLAGAAALRAGLIEPTGMVSELEAFRPLRLADPGRFVFGGHEIRPGDLVTAAARFHRRTGVLHPDILRRVRAALRRADARIRPGFTLDRAAGAPKVAAGVHVGRGVSPRALVDRVRRDLRAFQGAERLERVIVVHLATTEGVASERVSRLDWRGFERRLAGRTAAGFTASLLYGWAALSERMPFINFTPSPGAEHPALAELAAAQGVPVAGNDGKTGETLVKTVLAPMFLCRNLKLRTWFGYNLLGNDDGAALADPRRCASKLKTKDAALTRMVQDPELRSKVTIDFAPSLDDWKTAWDFIHFEGFLGTRMSLQFCWQASDSALAAPLVLDLVRFTERSARLGESGPLTHLGSFFKAPLGVSEPDFHRQFARLLAYAGAGGA
ncbi:MAG: inositol-3-phosphate synthase [Planctomycetes bacterium]|nr:inositol-3-phosphate synthase [Planctomycetota bacterium]